MNIKQTKIRIKHKAEFEMIQRRLFDMGCIWGGDDKPRLFKMMAPYLYIDNYLTITLSRRDYAFFNNHINKEIKVNDLISHVREF